MPPLYHLMKRGLYYRHDAHGYTSDVNEAGVFSKEYAESDVLATLGEKDYRDRVTMIKAKMTEKEPDVKLEFAELDGDSKKLKAVWSPELEQILNDYFAIHPESTELQSHMIEFIQKACVG